MNDSIICPSCKKEIPLTEAITHQIDEKYRKELLAEKKKAEEERQKLINLSKKRIEEEKEKAGKEAEVKAREKITKEMELKLKDSHNEREELKEQNKNLQEQLLEMNKTLRQLKNDSKEKELELEKKFNEREEKLREEEQRKAQEENKFKLAEKDKKIEDALKLVEEYKRKLEQGSQQLQGEVLELSIEEFLIREFPFDDIEPVPKGITGADIIQVVKNRSGQKCGTIIWETKRTKNWSHEWIPKLKADQRKVKAEVAVLISQIIPDGINKFGLNDGVWICEFEFVIGLAYALRSQLMEVANVRTLQVGQQGKMEVLYNYITSTEFKHRIEAIIESFSNMQKDIEKERRWFAKKWAREEKNLRRVLDTTVAMHGDLQSIMGKSLKELKGMNMLEDDDLDNEEEIEEAEVETDRLF